MHNYSSRPYTFVVGDDAYLQDPERAHVEYHHFYGMNPSLPSAQYWYTPPPNPLPMYNPYMNYNNPTYARNQKLHPDAWPEGFTLKGELHWGRLERIFGQRREIPDFVKDDLRRVYGTYPRTHVMITYQNGEFLVKGDPMVGEQEYTVEKKVIRRGPTPSDTDADNNREVRDKKNKKKSKR